MTNREWLMEQMQNMSDEEFAETYDICGYIKEEECCIKKTATYCHDCELAWLKAEHKEIPKISDAERVILENADKKYEWIARDSDNELRVFKSKPSKNDGNFWIEENNGFARLSALNHIFQFIKWEDVEPYNIEELLKGE